MGKYEELSGGEAVKEVQEIVKHQGVCMMVSNTNVHPAHSRPMGVAEVDDGGTFWFLTLRTSAKYEELTQDPRTSLYFANPSKQEFLAIHGRTEVLNDMARKKELWKPVASAWVPNGVEDPDLRILKVTPEEGYYWDTKDGLVVAGAKILFAMVSRKANDDGGVEGKLKV